ncbi:arsenate reductase/protein-tyrosine-phosphatase family protein [Acidihalobacter aeolianus]|uniref:arsenate reductase/protein-tyrosine-phosphatase family protein n=1 Tax=Acidihalobacter aeolianus TaxID=2792603 RepID=UPI0018D318F8|nr:hypothetical protein [Acidihalobacter aeolianus]
MEAISHLLKCVLFDLVIPCDERTLLPLNWHRAKLEKLSKLAIPSEQCIKYFFNKHETRMLAASLNIPIAKGGRLLPEHDADHLISEVGLPIAIKASSSYTAERLYDRHKVTIARDKNTLEVTLRTLYHESCIYEGFFSGKGCGISVLAHRGRILQAFEHHREHEFEGSSYYRVSSPLTPSLIGAVEKIMFATEYTGVAMIEFRLDKNSNQWILLEINARPWGSLPLPVGLGVDFPFNWYQLLCKDIEGEPHDYRTGIYGRNLIPDTRLVLYHLQSFAKKPIEFTSFLLKTIPEYFRIFIGREIHDVLVLDDPTPFYNEIRILLYDTQNRIRSKIKILNSNYESNRAKRSIKNKAITRIAIVCQGNICRSPFTEKLLKSYLSNNSLQHVSVESYGNLPREGYKSPPNAIHVAKSFGIDLLNHSSRHFSHDAATSAQLIIVFDEINKRWIQNRYPEIKTPIVFLGSFGTHDTIIKDPDGGDQALFTATYQIIKEATDNLARLLSDGYPNRAQA